MDDLAFTAGCTIVVLAFISAPWYAFAAAVVIFGLLLWRL